MTGGAVMSRESGHGPGGDRHVAAPPRGGPTGFQRSARRLSELAGSGGAAAAVTVAGGVWLVLGASSGFPRWWELVVTIGLPIITLLMVVLLQHTQNHDSRATQLKLDELIRVNDGTTNRMMTVEDASPGDLDRIQDDFRGQSGEGEAQECTPTGESGARGLTRTRISKEWLSTEWLSAIRSYPGTFRGCRQSVRLLQLLDLLSEGLEGSGRSRDRNLGNASVSSSCTWC